VVINIIRLFSFVFLAVMFAACNVDNNKKVIGSDMTDQAGSGLNVLGDDPSEPNIAFDPQPINNFTLLDHTGKSHELFYYDDAKAIVIMIQGNGCPIVRNSLNDYEVLSKKYSSKNIRFFMLNSNLQDDRESIAAEAATWGVSLPILVDDTQIVGRDLGLSRTAEVLIIDPRKREIVYRGPLHDRVSYEAQVDQVSVHYSEIALDALLAKQPIPEATEHVKGCLIHFPELMNVSYQEDVAPILLEHCVHCHQEGGIAPWPMISHAMVQGFAPMIKEVLRTRRMPPYDGDPLIGHWQDNPTLSYDQTFTLLSWIDKGAAKGDGGDPLVNYKPNGSEWKFGEPDLIVDIPAFDIPATGTIEYRYAEIVNTHDEDVWLSAATIMPGDASALHHLNVAVSGVDSESDISDAVADGYLLVWSPGTNLGQMPEGSGVLLPRNSKFLFEMHYTAYGKESVDESKLGLYFSKQAPEKIMRFGETAGVLLEIPPFRRVYNAHSYMLFDRDATVYMLGPHAHYRGKSFKYTYRYPDGREELALSVPSYDFNWQRGYSYVAPKKVPAGTMIIVTAEYDNSRFNEANPDPSATVRWGAQSLDEMLTGAFTFSWDDETSEHKTHDGNRWVINKKVGYLDVNMDGKIVASELPAGRRKLFDAFAAQVDSNGDGAVTYKEWQAKPEVQFF
ncbi:MAG: redoxin family protein, partial [Pseudomonadales bacterium]|nr:redoxin family protein [Pseudomonadales bacterium]